MNSQNKPIGTKTWHCDVCCKDYSLNSKYKHLITMIHEFKE